MNASPELVRVLGGALALLPVQYALIGFGWYGLYSIFIPVYAFLLLPILAALRGSTERFLVRVAQTQWALMIAVFCLSHVPALLTLSIPGHEGDGVLLIVWLVVVVQLSDVLQYVVGKLAGRTPVAPSLSPSKTREGTAVSSIGFFLAASSAGGVLADAVALGWAAAAAAVLSAYVRELGHRLGGTADFAGVMAKPQRMAVMTLACAIGVVVILLGQDGVSVTFRLALGLVLIGATWVALMRTRRLLHTLRTARSP